MSAHLYREPSTRRTPARDPWVRATGLALVGTGLLHVAFGAVIAREPLRILVSGGVVGAAPSNPVVESWFWYLVVGVPLLLAGHLVREVGRITGRVPGLVIPYLVVLGAAVVLYPWSGLWLFFLVAGLAAVAWRRGKSAQRGSIHCSRRHRATV